MDTDGGKEPFQDLGLERSIQHEQRIMEFRCERKNNLGYFPKPAVSQSVECGGFALAY